MISIFVTINIKDGFADKFSEASLGDSQGSVRDEPGCFRFDILRNSEVANRFHLYEVYKDEEALASHRKTPHFLNYFNLMQELGDKVERVAQLHDKLS